MSRVEASGLKVAAPLFDFVAKEAAPGTGVSAGRVLGRPRRHHQGPGAEEPRIAGHARRAAGEDRPVAPRQQGQGVRSRRLYEDAAGHRLSAARAGGARRRDRQVDDEIGKICGPQLVVPLTNARYALNAANARWGSLYDALYGTDAIPHEPGDAAVKGYNKARGDKVIAKAKSILDQAAPLENGSHADVTAYTVENGALIATTRAGPHRAEARAAVRRLSGRRRRRRAPCCWSTTACTSRSASIATTRSARTTRRASPTSCSNPPSAPSSTWKTASPRSMPRTRCWSIATRSD